MNNINLLMRGGPVLLASLLLSACATTPPGNSLAQLEQQLGEHYPNAKFQQAAPALTDQTFTLAAAIQTLLARSPQVRMEIAQLGVADAQLLQAELISNPHLSLGALKPEDGGRWQLDVGLSQPLLELFTRPLRRQLAQENLLSVQLRLQAQLQDLIATTSAAYYSAIAAQQHLQIQRQMLDATLARQQLANSLYRAGNMSENSFLYYDNEARRVQQQVKKRERAAREKYLDLLNLMGLDSSQSIALPTRLPVLPTETFVHGDLLTRAHTDRLDIKITRQQLNQVEQRRSLVRQENGWRDMSIGVNAEREFDGQTNIGPEIEFALPVFNRNQGKLAAMDAQNEKLAAQLTQQQLEADIEIAQALDQMHSSREQLALLQTSLQVAEKRVRLSNREVNFMLGSPFELLNIKRQEIQLAHDYTNELAGYWQARTHLELATGRAIPVEDTAGQNKDHTTKDHSETDHSKMDHSEMDHNKMDHSEMDHNKMDHSKMDHSKMDHSKMDHSEMNHSEMDHSKMDHSAHDDGHQKTSDSTDKKTSEHEEHQHD